MGRVAKILIIALALAAAVAPLPRGAVERVYARGWYPVVQPRLTMLTNRTGYAVFDLMLLLVLGGVAAMWVVRLRRRHGGRAAIGPLLLDTTAIGAGLYLWFLIAWGFNYRREPLRSQMDYDEARITREAV